MTVLLNSFEGGTNGTTVSVANSGGASGSAFDVVSIGANSTLAYDSTHAAHGSLSAKVASGASSVVTLAEWTTSMGSQATVWFRAYLYFTANPSAGVRPFAARTGSGGAASIQVPFTGLLQLVNAGGMVQLAFTNAIPLNQWFRIEGYVTGDPSAGVISLSLYDSADSTTVTETHTLTGQDTAGTLSVYYFGNSLAGANQGPFWMDSIGLSSTGYIGPVVTGTAGHTPVSIVPSLVAAGVI